MRIYQPKNEYGQDLLSTADVVESIKTVTKTIADGKVEISKSDLGTDKASDWTVLEVVYGGNKIMADVASTDEKITVTLDDAGSTFAGNVTVTLTYESAMNITEDAQQPPVVKRGEIVGLTHYENSPFIEGPIVLWDCNLPDLQDGTGMFSFKDLMTSFSGDVPKMTNAYGMFYNCTSLTSFDGDLSALSNGYCMFDGCRSLTSFSGDLPALTNGTSMFYNCKLDQASVDKILATIRDLKSKPGTPQEQETYGYGNLALYVASGVNKHTSEFAAKGWTVK